ncbi:Hypothetical protein D9617_1g084280 [Elsinoe fawcettii]|nr:Hypothetical protein D9617_1g084280 [Elsinoe fawcettii]
MADDVPISNLQPYETIVQSSTIRAEVSLVWPYSSSHASAALLLVDPDFRKRHARGQVRAVFRGPAARALAKAHIGIGDILRIDLGGAKWQDRNERAATLTPGKAVEAELCFERTLGVTVLEDATGAVDERVVKVTEPTPPSSPQNRKQVGPVTPGPQSSGTGRLGLRTPFGGGYASPAFMKRLRLSQEHFLESPGLSSSTTPEGSQSTKRRRLSYKNVTEWRFAGGSPIKEARTTDNDAEDEDEDVMMGQSLRASHGQSSSAEAAMPPSPRTALSTDIIASVGGLNADQPVAISSDTDSGDEDDDDDNDVESIDGQRLTTLDQYSPPLPTDLHSQQRRLNIPPMAPPPLPRLQMPAPSTLGSAEPRTPELKPISAANLPLPSPFPQTPLARTSTHVEVQSQVPEPVDDQSDEHPRIETTGYFDNPPSDTHNDEAMDGMTKSEVSLMRPLAEVIQNTDLMEGHVEGHASPSEGSEADLSSEADEQTDDNRTANGAEMMRRSSRSSVGIRMVAGNSDMLEDSADIEPETSMNFGDQYQADVQEDGLSGVSEPSDDDDGDVDMGAPINYPDPSITMTTNSDATSAGDLADRGLTRDESSAIDHPYGLDGSTLSRRSHSAKDHGEQEISRSARPDEHLSQDEDAAFAALDEALHTHAGHVIEAHQPPVTTLSSAIGPGRVPSVEPAITHEEPVDTPAANVESQTKEEQTKYHANEQDVDAEAGKYRQDAYTAVRPESPTRPRLPLIEPKQRAIERTAQLQRKSPPKRSPSIEVVDLTEVGPIPFPRSTSARRQIPARPESIPDSVDSPVTTLALDSSPPARTARRKSSSPCDDVVGSQFAVQASQELGGTQYKAPSTKSRPTSQLSRIAEDKDQEIEDEKDLDERIFAALDEDDSATEHGKAREPQDTRPANSATSQPPTDSLPDVSSDAMSDQLLPTQSRTSRRRSRLSLNHAALATWFTPHRPLSPSRRKTIAALPEPLDFLNKVPSSTAPAPTIIRHRGEKKKKFRSISPPQLKRYAQSQGLSTKLSYFTPLTNLDLQLGGNGGKVDVLAVATGRADEVKRAKAGPRDWFTVLRISDPGVWEQEAATLAKSQGDGDAGAGEEEEVKGEVTNRELEGKGKGKVLGNGHANAGEDQANTECNGTEGGRGAREDIRVEVYRPWKASLPSVEAGDVILLRAFHVKSRDRRTYLLSGEESAWCVFRFGEEDGEKHPARTRIGPREEIKGPPLEIGDEERGRAQELRGWWELVQKVEESQGR